MTTVKKYRIYCDTEAKWVSQWSETPITSCPNDNTHTINLSSLQELDTISTTEVQIKEEKPPNNAPKTGGHYATTCVCLDIPAAVIAGEVTSASKTYDFPTGLIAVHFTTTSNMEGDILHADVGPNTIIGTITEDVDIGATCVDIGISVSQTVIDNLEVGYFVDLYDGTNTNELGHCIEIDTTNKIIKLENETTDSFDANTPTYVRQSIKMLQDFTIGPPMTYRLGMNTVGASYIPSGITGTFTYENWDMNPKKLYIYCELFY